MPGGGLRVVRTAVEMPSVSGPASVDDALYSIGIVADGHGKDAATSPPRRLALKPLQHDTASTSSLQGPGIAPVRGLDRSKRLQAAVKPTRPKLCCQFSTL